MDTNLMLDFLSPWSPYHLSFEDDGKVAYAYLENDSGIVGDVWLYNRCAPPAVTEWKDKTNIPFANCVGYVAEDGVMRRQVRHGDVIVDWESNEDGPVAYVYVFEDLYAVVGVGDKPGCARFAAKDGPLALVMEIED